MKSDRCGCGGKAILTDYTVEGAAKQYSVACETCFMGLPYGFDTPDDAWAAWRRAMGTPWVKTSDRLPTEADADNTMCWVLATTISSNLPMPEAIAYIRANPDNYPYWMPIPPLPEVEG